MSKLKGYINKHLSTKLSLWVLLSVVLLFVAALSAMFRFSQKTLEHESLEKAQETLNGTVLRIDNMLKHVEVDTRNTLWTIEHHLEDPEAMEAYSRDIVKSDEHIVGCAIAFESHFYPQKGELFMTYTHRTSEGSDSLVTTHNPTAIEPFYNSPLPYVAHNWYNIPKQEDAVCWIMPHAPNDNVTPKVLACSMPIHDRQGRIVGVMRADIAVNWLSSTILDTKPYPNSYCAMLGVMGIYIIHPDLANLHDTTVRDIVKKYGDVRADSLVESMLRGEDGCRPVTMNGKEFYVLYKALNNHHWSACIVCPENDIFGSNRRLFGYMIGLTIVGIFLIFGFCMFFVSRRLQPLYMLAESAERIADGDFSEPIPKTTQSDEVGTLQNSFGTMQTALSKHIDRIKTLSENLQHRNEELNIIHQQTEEENQMKMSLIHKIADKMVPPAKSIDIIVGNLREHYQSITPDRLQPMSEQVLAQTKTMTDLLDRMLKTPQKKPIKNSSNNKPQSTT